MNVGRQRWVWSHIKNEKWLPLDILASCIQYRMAVHANPAMTWMRLVLPVSQALMNVDPSTGTLVSLAANFLFCEQPDSCCAIFRFALASPLVWAPPC